MRQIKEAWSSFPPSVAERLTGLLQRIAARKLELHALVAASGADRLCQPCGGQCCFGGRHHVTVVDLLAHLAPGGAIFTPCFDAPVCSYLGAGGCLMSPPLRPRTCIVFLCEQVLERMGADERSSIDRLERDIALLYEAVGGLLGISPSTSILIAAERAVARGDRLIDAAALNKE